MSVMPGYPVPRSQWATSGEACTACSKRFSFFSSKENCPCCGRLFCSSCLSAECTLSPMGLPSAICLECFQKIQDWRRGIREQQRREAASVETSSAAASASPSTAPAAEAKLTTLEGELDRLKKSGQQLREESDSLIELLAAKDVCIAELTERQQRADAVVESTSQANAATQQQMRSFTEARAEAAKSLLELQEKLSASQEVNGSLTEKVDALANTNAALTAELSKLKEEIAARSTRITDDAAELQSLRDAANAASMRSSQEVENVKSSLQSLSEEAADLRHERDTAVEKASKVIADLENLRESAQSWEAERSSFEAELSRLRAALDESSSSLRLFQQRQLDDAKSVESATAAQVTEQQEKISALTEQGARMRASLESLEARKQELEASNAQERQTRADAESRIGALMEEVALFKAKEQEWNEQIKRDAERMQELVAAADRASREAAEAWQQLQSSAEQTESSATAQLAEKQHAIASLTNELNTAGKSVQSLRTELATSQESVAALHEQLRQVEDGAEAKLAAALANAAAESEKTRASLAQQEEANARLSSQLSAKTRELSEFQQRHLSAAKDAKEEIQMLRQQCAAARASYESERQAWETSLTELRNALAQMETQFDSNVPQAATDATSQTEPGANGSRNTSRWARPTRVEKILYEPQQFVAAEEIAAVTGLDRWEFDTKAEAARSAAPDALVRIGYQIALDWLLFPNTDSLRRWVNMLNTVQINYRANPYHNKVHAADVLQGVYALVLQCPGLLANMTKTEKRAVVFAAAVHDVRHPGRTEAFLKRTFDATYFAFSGCKVLELMHTATAFQLLGHADLDFTQDDMDDDEVLRFHGLVASLIGVTYMGSHATLMQTWSRPLREGSSYDFTKEGDRHTVLGMLLHAADIGAQSRGIDVALKWLGVVEEMYEQGDEESALGLPVSPGNDRGGNLAKGQLFFLEMFVVPLFDLIHQLFPQVDAPMRNLRALHAHYTAALKEPARSFPHPVPYAAEADKQNCTRDAEAAEAAERRSAIAAREDAVIKREKTLEQAVQRLRQATATVAQREAQLSEKEALLAAQLSEVDAVAHEAESTRASQQTEEELHRATAAVVEREESVQRKTAELEALATDLEQREAVASQLSSQLATIAERVNRRRQLLRYREARLRSREAATAQNGHLDDHNEAAATAFTLNSRASEEPSQQLSLSPSRTAEMAKLKSALNKLNSAMRFM